MARSALLQGFHLPEPEHSSLSSPEGQVASCCTSKRIVPSTHSAIEFKRILMKTLFKGKAEF